MGVATVVSINVSNGGVPKLPITSARVTTLGVEGDRHADPKHHGGPDQALCLYPREVIEHWQAEGHPIGIGSVGENFTIAGLDWDALDEGVRLRIGADVVAELTWPAVPCTKQARWFTDGDFSRLSEQRHPGKSRWYAKVLTEGIVNVGDEVVVDAAQPSSRSA